MTKLFRRLDRSKRLGRRQPAPRRCEQLENRFALSATALGDAELVNDFVPGWQSAEGSTVAVAASATNRVVVWEGRGPVDHEGVFAQVYNADGGAVGDAFRVNSTIRGSQHSPAVAVDADGDFVVVWAGRGVADKQGVFLQRFNSEGEQVGEEVIVNTTLGGAQTTPAIAMDDSGSFIVTWEGPGRGDSTGVFFRRFNSEGALSTTETRVNSTTADEQRGATVTFLEGGGFVIGWQSRHQDGSDWGVYSQTYNSVGLTVGDEAALNATTTDSQSEVRFAAGADGGYVATWQSHAQDGDSWGVVARAFGADGAASGDEVVLNESATGHQVRPALAVAADGQWLAAWTSGVPDGAGWETVLRAYEPDGATNDSALASQPSGANSAHQGGGSVAIDGETAIVVWSGEGDADHDGVYQRQYQITPIDDGPQQSPDLAAIDDQTIEIGTQLEVTVTATDPNFLDDLTFDLDVDNSPTGATIEQTGANTAIVRWTPGENDGDTATFRVIVTDNGEPVLADAEEFTVTITDAPLAIDLNGADNEGGASESTFLVGDLALQGVAPQLTITGADGGMISGASATLAETPDGDLEVLSVSVAGTSITTTYDAVTRTLTLVGEASVETYQDVLRTLIYNNTAERPTGQRAVQVVVTDSDDDTAQQFASIDIVQPDLVGLAQAIADSGATFYGAAWCPHCTDQKELFEDGGVLLPFVEVTNPDRTRNDIGDTNNITTYPTWVFSDGTRAEGVQTLFRLAQLAGVDVPTSEDPYLAPLDDATLLVGSPLHVALDGYDSNGGPLTYTVTSDNADVTAEVLSGNRSARVDVAGYGDLVFQLFEQRASRATDRFIELAEDDFYDDIIFHRILNGFVIQGGDPLGNGTGGSTLGDYDDQFHVDLQHNRTGLLSMAKSSDDTNDSQFFITEGDNTASLRNLDFNHTVFGMLVEGESNRAAISDTEVEANPNNGGAIEVPTNTIQMEDVEIFTDTENAVLFLKAADGATGTANITVTVTDQDGNMSSRTFEVTLEDDASNGRPFLQDIADQSGTVNTEKQFQVNSADAEGDQVFYIIRPATADTSGLTQDDVEIDENGLVTLTPPTDFSGTLLLEVSVHSGVHEVSEGDFQIVPVTFA